jgi:RNA recognition motif-containing protein
VAYPNRLLEVLTLITLFIRGLPKSMTEEGLTALFAEYGSVRSLKMSKDLFSGECKGFANIDMEGHEARAAIAALDGKAVNGSMIQVAQDNPRKGRGRRR